MPTLMVLEDDNDLRELLLEFFTARSFQALPARSGTEAIAQATRHRLDLVLVDVRMEGMDGLECLAALRQAQPGLRSIIMTGYADADAPARALRLRADDYVYKPFKFGDLLLRVRKTLERGREREGALALIAPFLKKVFGQSEPEHGWELLRDLAFQSYYVGVRSRHLNRDAAYSLWGELERLVLQGEGRDDLATAYESLIDRMAALSHNSMFVPRPGAGSVESDRFARFYNRLRDGEIHPEQLFIAPYLRTVPEATRREAPKLEELYDLVWS